MRFISRLIRLPLRLVPANRVVRILTGGLRGWRWITGSATHGAWIGSYERDAQRVFRDVIRPGAIVYDIGANVGFFTLLGSRLAGDDGLVCAFEPLPRNVEILERHLALNGVRNVRVFPIALSSRAGTARFHAAPNAAMGALTDEGELQVRVETLDRLVNDGTLPPPTFLKIDVEGAEHDVLTGAEDMLRREHPSILLSTHGSVQHARCVELLQRYGFALRLLRDPASDGNGVLLATAPDKAMPTTKRSATLALLIYLAIATAGCHWHRDWDRAEEFIGTLRCGMTVDAVRRLSRELGASEFAEPQLAGRPGIPDYYVSEHGRIGRLWSDGDRLVAHMSSVSSMAHEEADPRRVELCSAGTRSQQLHSLVLHRSSR